MPALPGCIGMIGEAWIGSGLSALRCAVWNRCIVAPGLRRALRIETFAHARSTPTHCTTISPLVASWVYALNADARGKDGLGGEDLVRCTSIGLYFLNLRPHSVE